jgi:hypothetical protein
LRLAKVDRGHALKPKLILGLIRLFSGKPAPGIVRTLLYRSDFFGEPQSALSEQVLRGPSEWSVGERELFAAFVSRLNQCPF